MIDELFLTALSKCGTASALAQEIGSSPSELTKFQTGDAGLKIHHIKKLFDVSGMALITAKEKKDIINTAVTFANLYQGKK
jgi:hypothetical protein